ncbi:hypothetical protein RSOLAG1IB_06214 [Rhizoctonia solani AG-1 IB]|uniref:Uncharacterized protein n=1 Tax=Thanatephorus cucumeris (strain AG1-IB / isolate 7/3/14) TaxID=1108050 RepID=A0A0B7FAK0_THACB|nr:hypothetical protein RSOLAG1IB_06214 [Rhizoctonia solani AG-1 IB]
MRICSLPHADCYYGAKGNSQGFDNMYVELGNSYACVVHFDCTRHRFEGPPVPLAHGGLGPGERSNTLRIKGQ